MERNSENKECNNLVSVIVPVYNAEKYISYCIDSILAQTYNNIELILVNDGSKDNSGLICDIYASQDRRVKAIHQKNSGPSVARNKGIKNSNGDFLQFVDADDKIDHFMIDRLLSVYKNDIDLVLCGYQSLIKFNQKNSKKTIVPSYEGCYSFSIFMELFPSLFKNNLINSPGNKLYDSTIIKGNDIGFPIGVHNGEDLLFNIEYLRHCKNIYIKKEPLYYYIDNNPFSLTKNYKSGFFENRKVVYNELNKFIMHSSKSYKMIEEVYTNYLLQSLANIFHEKNELTLKSKRNEINKVIRDEWVRDNLERFKQRTYQEKVVKFLLRCQSTLGIILYFGTKKFLRKHFKGFYNFIKRLNLSTHLR
ncbi:glycosyltransferase family 2 protein [Lentibacillus salicampi]|uniref:Glycosyltransferase n=1 Tax=Lentibacillus salicampi TaxID=175306 RepID=A0A4Y9AC93_9BACI|nr:glycosyltransferase [Lentibacillus salicampi]TFJ93045.1 glycosyltransferase [Lentibacillus salicampi]